jgi:hypothetical protein
MQKEHLDLPYILKKGLEKTWVCQTTYSGTALIPVALSMFYSANTTGWDADVLTVWGLIPIFVVLGLALYFIVRRRG